MAEADLKPVGEGYMGSVMTDVSGRRGQMIGTDAEGHKVVIKALIPQLELSRYAIDLRGIAHGTGTFTPGPDTNPFSGEPGQAHTGPEQRVEVLLPLHRQHAVVRALQQAHPYEEVAYDVIKLEISSARVEYFVHPGLLLQHSAYFARALNGKWKEAAERAICLADVECKTCE